jgi:hypothetical protein
MGSQGGYKHRKRKSDRKRTQRELKARESIRRIQHKYEAKGQTWEPANNPGQMAELTHDARRIVARTDYAKL